MIIKASQRSGAAQLAAHLTNVTDNDHVTVLELRGFIADDLQGAFAEAHAVSKATRCKQYLFSMSLNPPETVAANEQDFIDAAERAEQKLGLDGQARAIVIHEKEGRRHAHVVWSRIDTDTMTAINLPFYKQRLNELAKELYLENGWELPEGMKAHGGKNPMNFTRDEWQQAKRIDVDPREIKAVFREAFEQSDSLKAFGAAMADKGYFIAKGDRRGFVAVGLDGEVFAVPRWAGVKTKEANAKLGDPDQLEPVADVRRAVADRVAGKLKTFMAEVTDEHRQQLQPLKAEKMKLVQAQRLERQNLKSTQEQRWIEESKARNARVRKGLMGVMDFFTGRARAVRKENEADAQRCMIRDRKERNKIMRGQLSERQELQSRVREILHGQSLDRAELAKEVVHYMRLAERPVDKRLERMVDRTNDHDLTTGRGRDRSRPR